MLFHIDTLVTRNIILFVIFFNLGKKTAKVFYNVYFLSYCWQYKDNV